ncbi:MAG: SDR family oxidoreductase [Candidatus Margulisiibacteriota bacterium]
MNIDFKDQVVLITGATRGIGKQIADDMAAAGAQLILTGTKPGADNYFQVDFTNRKSLDSFISQLEKIKRIDVCINNAGINRINNIDETDPKDWDDIIAVNLTAPFLIIRAVAKLMKKQKYGRIVNISSIFGVVSKEKRSIYSASKFGLRGLTVAASNELARYGILVNSVCPGVVLTDLTKSILTEEEMKAIAAQIPAGRLATPDEISKVVLFLSSKLNTYLTGQDIIVDGGYVNV